MYPFFSEKPVIEKQDEISLFPGNNKDSQFNKMSYIHFVNPGTRHLKTNDYERPVITGSCVIYAVCCMW